MDHKEPNLRNFKNEEKLYLKVYLLTHSDFRMFALTYQNYTFTSSKLVYLNFPMNYIFWVGGDSLEITICRVLALAFSHRCLKSIIGRLESKNLRFLWLIAVVFQNSVVFCLISDSQFWSFWSEFQNCNCFSSQFIANFFILPTDFFVLFLTNWHIHRVSFPLFRQFHSEHE